MLTTLIRREWWEKGYERMCGIELNGRISFVVDVGRYIIDGLTTTTGMYWYVWIFMGINGYIWVYKGLYGYVWVCMDIYGY